MINVTKTFLPPQAEYQAILKRAWDNNWLTNRGVLVKELEINLKKYLGVQHILATANGTIPLHIAIKILNLKGEIITTPFSYVATTSSIVWEGCTPVFVDIHPEYLTIDETKIESAITPNTTAILATHVFGNPCHVEAIDVIAKKYGLKVIYDGAHAFGVQYKGNSIFNYGDISTCSFHATKLFHTGEGGALFFKSSDLNTRIFNCHNFGHNGPGEFDGVGTNAKMSELQAALGLSVLPYMKTIINNRSKVVEFYNNAFENKKIRKIKLRENVDWNYCYYPIILESEHDLKLVFNELLKNNINPRRYFFPSLNQLSYVQYSSQPISENISSKILCLPLYESILESELNLVINSINQVI